jgi:hypothetical protein
MIRGSTNRAVTSRAQRPVGRQMQRAGAVRLSARSRIRRRGRDGGEAMTRPGGGEARGPRGRKMPRSQDERGA